jgi:hypothetical protein
MSVKRPEGLNGNRGNTRVNGYGRAFGRVFGFQDMRSQSCERRCLVLDLASLLGGICRGVETVGRYRRFLFNFLPSSCFTARRAPGRGQCAKTRP